MGSFYLDIETTGIDEVQNKIITIQYAELERGTGRMAGKLTILKEWELGEEEMIRRFVEDTDITSDYGFDFIPVGYNLAFEHRFLLEKSNKYNELFPISVLSRPHIDLHSIGILMNNGEFRGSGLDKLTGKSHSGMPIVHWYDVKKYGEIENYVRNEAREFVRWLEWLHRELPSMRDRWKDDLAASKS